MLKQRGKFEYKRELYDGYDIGKVIVDLRGNKVEVEVIYHQSQKKSLKVIKHPFQVDLEEVDIQDLLDKIYNLHY